MRNVYKQIGSGVRFDWGLTGASALNSTKGCLVVIDVLSFTTTVSVAVSKGIQVLPYKWRDETVSIFAEQQDAVLVADRGEATDDKPWTLSPASILNSPHVEKLVIPSPNGSSIAAASDAMVVAASLRNGSAVGKWLIEAGYGTTELPIVVIASGEHWTSNNTLRPCVEDLIGAGLVISELQLGGCVLSTEAEIAASVFRSVSNVETALTDCASGRELIEDGYEEDVLVASQVNADSAVPILSNSVFTDALAMG